MSQRRCNPAGEKSCFNEPIGGKLTPVGNGLAPAPVDVCKVTLDVTVDRRDVVREWIGADV